MKKIKPTQGKYAIGSIDYINKSEDATRRLKRGERQLFCVKCRRWHWLDEKCHCNRRSEGE